MDNKFQIILYIAFGLVWIYTSINKAKKEKLKKQQAAEPLVPLPGGGGNADKQKAQIDEFERVIEEIKHRDKVGSEIETPIGVPITRDPYKESIEFTARKKRRRASEAVLAEKKEGETIEMEGVDWKKAVIYSEVLRTKF